MIGPLTAKFPTPIGEIGFAHGGLHSFRHYFVTEAFLGGASDGEVRDWVGHRDSRIVERYPHLRDSAAKRTMAKLHFIDVMDGAGATGKMSNNDGAEPASGNGGDGKNNGNNKQRESDGPNGSAPR